MHTPLGLNEQHIFTANVSGNEMRL